MYYFLSEYQYLNFVDRFLNIEVRVNVCCGIKYLLLSQELCLS